MQLPSYLPDPLSELAPGIIHPGCRGFIGPVPPPLWIEVPFRGYLINSEFIMPAKKCQMTKDREQGFLLGEKVQIFGVTLCLDRCI